MVSLCVSKIVFLKVPIKVSICIMKPLFCNWQLGRKKLVKFRVISYRAILWVIQLNLYKVYLRDQQNVVLMHRLPLYVGSVAWKLCPWGPGKCLCEVIFIYIWYRWSLEQVSLYYSRSSLARPLPSVDLSWNTTDVWPKEWQSTRAGVVKNKGQSLTSVTFLTNHIAQRLVESQNIDMSIVKTSIPEFNFALDSTGPLRPYFMDSRVVVCQDRC